MRVAKRRTGGVVHKVSQKEPPFRQRPGVVQRRLTPGQAPLTLLAHPRGGHQHDASVPNAPNSNAEGGAPLRHKNTLRHGFSLLQVCLTCMLTAACGLSASTPVQPTAAPTQGPSKE